MALKGIVIALLPESGGKSDLRVWDGAWKDAKAGCKLLDLETARSIAQHADESTLNTQYIIRSVIVNAQHFERPKNLLKTFREVDERCVALIRDGKSEEAISMLEAYLTDVNKLLKEIEPA